MCMLHFFIENAEKLPPFTVLNFEHGLRGEESSADSAFVSEYCKKRGVKCDVAELDCKTFCRQHGYGIEQGARILRRREFERIVKCGMADRVLTAHHADDNAESILMHIFRGSGLKGLCGIPRDDGVVYRPLIDTSSEEIAEYARQKGVPYREDSSNNDTGFSRNYVRKVLLPMIQERFPNAKAGISMLGRRAAQAYEYIAEHSPQAKMQGQAAVLDIEDLRGVTGETAVFEALISAIFALAESENGSTVCLPSAYRACRAGEQVHFYRETPVFTGEVPFETGGAALGEYEVIVSKKSETGALRVNGAAVPKDAVWRTRRDGDFFLPFGGGRRSLGDWFTDKKVPKYLRAHIPVLADGKEIYAVAGMEISKKLKVEEGDNCLYISVRRIQ